MVVAARALVYELLYDGNGKDGKPFLCGLIEVDKLRVLSEPSAVAGGLTPKECDYDVNRSGVKVEWSGQTPTGRGQVGLKSVGCRGVVGLSQLLLLKR